MDRGTTPAIYALGDPNFWRIELEKRPLVQWAALSSMTVLVLYPGPHLHIAGHILNRIPLPCRLASRLPYWDSSAENPGRRYVVRYQPPHCDCWSNGPRTCSGVFPIRSAWVPAGLRRRSSSLVGCAGQLLTTSHLKVGELNFQRLA
jgi:hypothetical protein